MKTIRHKLSVAFLWLAFKVDPNFINNLIHSQPSEVGMVTDEVNKIAEKLAMAQIKSDEPSGIVYRPTAEELKKMKEDKATKEAKEAIAETLRNIEEPEI